MCDVGCVQEHTLGRLLWFVRMCIGKHRGRLECQETKAEYRAGKSKMTRYRQSHGRRGLEKRLVKSPMCVVLSVEWYLEARRNKRLN